EARIELSTERRDLPDMAGAARLLYGSRQVSERGEPQIGGHAGEGVRGRPHLDEIHVAPGRGETVAMGTRMLGQLRDELAHLGRSQGIDEQTHVGLVDRAGRTSM